MDLDLSLTPCSGHATGSVYQFAEGAWPRSVIGGVFVSETAFDFILPIIQSAWPNWDALAIYGVTNIKPELSIALIAELRSAADRMIEARRSPEWAGYSSEFTPEDVKRHFDENPKGLDELARLFRELANWLEAAMARSPALSLLGI